MHAGGGQPDTRSRLVLGGIDDRHPANPSPAQREGKSAAALPAADDHDIVVDTLSLGHPILRVRPDQSQSIAGFLIGIGRLEHVLWRELCQFVGNSIIGQRIDARKPSSFRSPNWIPLRKRSKRRSTILLIPALGPSRWSAHPATATLDP